jgi:hypothetical protein
LGAESFGRAHPLIPITQELSLHGCGFGWNDYGRMVGNPEVGPKRRSRTLARLGMRSLSADSKTLRRSPFPLYPDPISPERSLYSTNTSSH